MSICERSACRVEREIRRHFPRRCDVALANAGTLNNPLVGGLNGPREFVVADDPRRQIGAATEYDRTQNCHAPAPPTSRAVVPAFRSRAIDCPIFSSNS